MSRRKLCESCGEPACFVLRRSIGEGRTSERWLCADCARDAESVMFGGGLLMTDVLLEAVSGGSGRSACPVCGNSVSEVRKTGMMGCDACYDFFRADIEPIVREIHG